MRLYIGDYMSDAIGLTNAEHGVYMISIFKYWSKGESLTDAELKDICTQVHIDRISRFFVFEGNRWHHKRIDGELATSRKRWQAAQKRSMAGVDARRKLGQIP